MCEPDLTCANCAANGGTSFPEQLFPSPPTGILGLRVVRLETDAQHGAKKLTLVKGLVQVRSLRCKWCGVGLPAPQVDRHHMTGRRRRGAPSQTMNDAQA